MRARIHGEIGASSVIAGVAERIPGRRARAAALFQAAGPSVGYMFPDLANAEHQELLKHPQTREAVTQLGDAMGEVSGGPGQANSQISAAFTYFGQFIDHDITLVDVRTDASQEVRDRHQVNSPNLAPLFPDTVIGDLANQRTPALDLDSVYGGLAQEAQPNGIMAIGKVTTIEDFVTGKELWNDLPRKDPNSENEIEDRTALIGDPRNDENLIVAQLHLAFLRAHNALMAQGHARDEAKAELTRRYHAAVLKDFLGAVCDKGVLAEVLQYGAKHLPEAPRVIPLEFAAAAFRFGHSMIRDEYDFNEFFGRNGKTRPSATLGLLFTFTALSGENFDFPTLPSNWIIEWERLIANKAKRIDTNLADALKLMPGPDGQVPGGGEPEDAAKPSDQTNIAARLAVRNLRRGVLLSIPTGQAMAARLGVPVLTPEQVHEAAGSDAQKAALDAHKGFLKTRTPLWYYILAEAKHHHQGERLGPVGSRILAETFYRLYQWAGGRLKQGGAVDLDDVADPSLAGIIRLSGNLA